MDIQKDKGFSSILDLKNWVELDYDVECNSGELVDLRNSEAKLSLIELRILMPEMISGLYVY